MAQVEIIRGLLQKANPSLRAESKIIKTSGDNSVNLSLVAGGGKGLFTKEIEEQLLNGDIHVAVHSMKDLPTILPDGLTIGAVPPREDAPRCVYLEEVSVDLATAEWRPRRHQQHPASRTAISETA